MISLRPHRPRCNFAVETFTAEPFAVRTFIVEAYHVPRKQSVFLSLKSQDTRPGALVRAFSWKMKC